MGCFCLTEVRTKVNLRLKNKFNFVISILLIVFISTVQCFSSAKREISSIISRIEKKYTISLTYDDIPEATWDRVKYKIASQADYGQLLKYMKLFQREFSKYLKEFIKKTELKNVSFVKNLSFSGQLRTAVPDYKKEILFLDFARGSHSTIYQKHVIHHEFYHMIEEQFNGEPYWKDPNWMAFNDKHFTYGKGGAAVQSRSDMYELTHPEKGFINLYSMTGVEEDKAEIYASLFIKAESRKINRWIKKDTILRKKVRYMKDFLFSCCEDMNAEYWKDYKIAENGKKREKTNSNPVIKEKSR